MKIVLALLLSITPLIAQEKPELPKAATVEAKTPELTELQKSTVQNFVLKITKNQTDIENAQLRIALLQADLSKAQTEAGQFVQTLQKECFTLDLDKMTYTPVKDCKVK